MGYLGRVIEVVLDGVLSEGEFTYMSPVTSMSVLLGFVCVNFKYLEAHQMFGFCVE